MKSGVLIKICDDWSQRYNNSVTPYVYTEKRKNGFHLKRNELLLFWKLCEHSASLSAWCGDGKVCYQLLILSTLQLVETEANPICFKIL